MTAEVAHGAFEYRTQGGEIHRRPIDRERLSPTDAAWLVLNRDHDRRLVPQPVLAHFEQAKDKGALN